MLDIDAWARQLAGHLQEHMDTEREVLRSYGHLAEESTNDHVRYLINLILDDEVRHHRLFSEMIAWLRAESESRNPIGPTVPSARAILDDPGLVAKTDELLQIEREDARELAELKEQVADVDDTRWWTVLIETMELDTNKHIRLLEYIRGLAAD